jgi:hypothetical protein
MSITHCNRCKQIMAAVLPRCPHCDAPQNEPSHAEGGLWDRTAWLAVGVGAALGMAGGWAVGGGAEELAAGLTVGVVAGLVCNVLRHR